MKTPLVFISGLLSNASLWEHQYKHLNDIASIHIISPTENTPDKMVETILKKAPETFALAGHSMGGWLCLEVMKAASSRISKLCLLNTTSRMDSEEKKNRRQQMILNAQTGKFQTVVEEIADLFVFNTAIKNNVKNMFLKAGKEAFIAQQESMIRRKESKSILPTISCPTLLIHAVQDKNFSLEEQRELASQIKESKLAIVEDSGHMSPMEVPQAITALLRFWLTYF